MESALYHHSTGPYLGSQIRGLTLHMTIALAILTSDCAGGHYDHIRVVFLGYQPYSYSRQSFLGIFKQF